jgi:hypothetical protein
LLAPGSRRVGLCGRSLGIVWTDHSRLRGCRLSHRLVVLTRSGRAEPGEVARRALFRGGCRHRWLPAGAGSLSAAEVCESSGRQLYQRRPLLCAPASQAECSRRRNRRRVVAGLAASMAPNTVLLLGRRPCWRSGGADFERLGNEGVGRSAEVWVGGRRGGVGRLSRNRFRCGWCRLPLMAAGCGGRRRLSLGATPPPAPGGVAGGQAFLNG